MAEVGARFQKLAHRKIWQSHGSYVSLSG